MDTNSRMIWIVVAVIVVVGAVLIFLNINPSANTSSNTTIDMNSASTASTTPENPMSATVAHDSNGFSPDTVTVAIGATVTWANSGTGQMWVATNAHPTHTDYDETSRTAHCTAGYTGPTPFDECRGGDSYSFTFTKAGTFGYHNHLNPNETGAIIVQ